MIPGSDQDRFERILKWMIANLEVSSSVHRLPDGTLVVEPGLTVTADGEVVRTDSHTLEEPNGWQLSSSTALIACCYIDALGKAMLKGDGSNTDRFTTFVSTHMRDFVAECQEKGGKHTIKYLFKVYRCGFVHQFADREAHWGRRGRKGSYWIGAPDEPGLNVDRFVQGVVAGITEFRTTFPAQHGPTAYADFFTWLTTDA